MTSAQRKLNRGIEHVKTVYAEAKAFEDGGAYVLRVEREVRSREEVFCDCFAVEREPPPDHWPLLIGEALQNLRASLDHAVFALKGKQFPVFIDPCEFQVRGRPMIARVPKAIRAVIEDSQPYKGVELASWWDARWDPLAVLNRFANRDKHRQLNTVASFVGMPYIGHDGANIEFTMTGEGRPLHDGTRITSFILRGPEALQVDVYPNFTYDVRLEGIPLISGLEGIVWRVEQVVAACEGRQPLPLWLRPLGHGEPD